MFYLRQEKLLFRAHFISDVVEAEGSLSSSYVKKVQSVLLPSKLQVGDAFMSADGLLE